MFNSENFLYWVQYKFWLTRHLIDYVQQQSRPRTGVYVNVMHVWIMAVFGCFGKKILTYIYTYFKY